MTRVYGDIKEVYIASQGWVRYNAQPLNTIEMLNVSYVILDSESDEIINTGTEDFSRDRWCKLQKIELNNNSNPFTTLTDNLTETIQQGIDKINTVFPGITNRITLNIQTMDKLQFCSVRTAWEGVYFSDFKQIYIKANAEVKTVIHEIAHQIHDVIFNHKSFRFDKEGKEKYAEKNGKENFACLFTDTVLKLIGDKKGKMYKRNEQMVKLIKSL